MDGKVVGHDLHHDLGIGLHALQHVEAAPAALALGAVGGVGHHLQFAQHELRHHHHAVDKAGFGDIGDAAVDDDAGIEHLGAFALGLLPAEDGSQGGGIEQVALAGAHQQSHVGHQQQDEDLHRGGGRSAQRSRTQHQAEQRRAEDAENAAGYRADQAAQSERPDPDFKDNDRAGSDSPCARTHPASQAEGMKEITNYGE